MFNCAAVKKWKRLVAWFPSYGAKRIADAECKFSRKLALLREIVLSPYTIVLRKIDLCSSKGS